MSQELRIRDRTAIVGIGQTEWGKGLEDSETVLALRAIKAALDDAGISPGEVDGLSSYTLETTDEVDIARNLGLGDITWFSQVGYGGGAGCGVVGHAAVAVATGQANVAVAWRGCIDVSQIIERWRPKPCDWIPVCAVIFIFANVGDDIGL